MRFLDEYRDGAAAQRYAESLRAIVTRPWTLMEVCGGQTHAIVRYGIDEMLPAGVTLVHGPGCPVCVTPVASLDRAFRIARRPGVVFTSFGDMLRVPGTSDDLLHVRAEGGDVRVVYSPLDAVAIAEREPGREVVFFAVGFETTAPANAMAVRLAAQKGLRNFSLLVAQVRVPPALEAILADPDCRVQAFLAAGHVCTVMGTAEYGPLVARHRVPVVVTGFEPLDLLQGVAMAVRQLEEGRADVEIQYARVVRPEGNAVARRAIEEVFEVTDRTWRGLGPIPRSGLGLNARYAAFDAERRFPDDAPAAVEDPACRAGLVLQGRLRPQECPAFGTRCTPEHPLGAPMVSSEGACAAYWLYRRRRAAAEAAAPAVAGAGVPAEAAAGAATGAS
ncbi:MAG TPA: hydrogenase formation protein HypD [Gemmatimonadales bacterium]|nr:hydrogenase formation protein HypD [Gemmatimonadales bacterium]